MARRYTHRALWPTRPAPYPRYDGTQLCLDIGADAFVIPGDQHEENAALKRVCGPCPFLEPCREFAVSYDVMGVWGGTTYAERRRIREKLKIRPIPVALPDAGAAIAKVRLLDDGTRTARELAELVGCSMTTVERARSAAA